MSAMAEMSKAIRETLVKHSRSGRLQSIPDDVLAEFVQIVGAFYFDLKEELARRQERA